MTICKRTQGPGGDDKTIGHALGAECVENSTPARCAQFPSRRCARRARTLSRHLPARRAALGRGQHRTRHVDRYSGRPSRPDAGRRAGRCGACQACPRRHRSPLCHFCFPVASLAAGFLASCSLTSCGARSRGGLCARDCCDHAGCGGTRGVCPSHRPQRILQSRRQRFCSSRGGRLCLCLGSSCSSCWRSCRWPALRAR